jgi:subtilisin family serine protease
MWMEAFYYETIDLNVTADRDWVVGMMDWSFVDDVDEGYMYGVGAGKDPIAAADLDDDGMDDIGLGALSWAYDSLGYLSVTDEVLFCGISENNLAFNLLTAGTYSSSAHGHWCAAAAASRGVVDHQIYNQNDPTNHENYTLEGIAPGAKLIATKGLTDGGDVIAEFWAAGFHLAADGNFTYQEDAGHKAHMISNSWGYVGGSRLDLTYLTLAWDLLSAPGIIDDDYPGTLFFVSAGNSGADYMTSSPPATAFSTVSVGATYVPHIYENIYAEGQETTSQQVWFSSNGPSFIGAPKPDVVAPGLFGANPTPFHNVWGNFGDSYTWWSGTSLACPIATGVAALIVEAMLDAGWSYDPALIKALLLSSATD